MKNDYLSVFTLYVRLTYGKLLAVLVIMSGLEALLLYFKGMNEASFKEAAMNSGLPFVTAAALTAISYILIFCCGGGSQAIYTLARLKISLNKVFYVALTYFTSVYLVFWFVQAFALFILSGRFTANAPEAMEAPHIFVSFALSRYLSLFIPVRGIMMYFVNIMRILFISTIAAAAHLDLVRGRNKGIKGITGIAVPLIAAILSSPAPKPSVYSVYIAAALAAAVLFVLMIRAKYDSAEPFNITDDDVRQIENVRQAAGGGI